MLNLAAAARPIDSWKTAEESINACSLEVRVKSWLQHMIDMKDKPNFKQSNPNPIFKPGIMAQPRRRPPYSRRGTISFASVEPRSRVSDEH
jgi:hypothetical protein